jgi:hypothetical protein
MEKVLFQQHGLSTLYLSYTHDTMLSAFTRRCWLSIEEYSCERAPGWPRAKGNQKSSNQRQDKKDQDILERHVSCNLLGYSF